MVDKKIKCDAVNCYFNKHDSFCSAQQIKVKGMAAEECEGTMCSSFRTKNAKAENFVTPT